MDHGLGKSSGMRAPAEAGEFWLPNRVVANVATGRRAPNPAQMPLSSSLARVELSWAPGPAIAFGNGYAFYRLYPDCV
jgi:hypothetical protein